MREEFTFWLISIIIICCFGIFWTLNLSNAKVDFSIDMDDNTLASVERMADMIERQEKLSCSNVCSDLAYHFEQTINCRQYCTELMKE